MPQLDANVTWFRFTVSGGPDFAVYAFTGRERVSEPYEFSVELVSPLGDIDLIDLIGREACLSVADKSGASRPVHGVIRAVEHLHSGNARTHYRCLLVPRLWFLGQTRDHRIFQQQSVPDIIARILREQGFTAEAFAFKCFTKYQPREYCVQYGESDLHFLSRLCEEEGIYYYFEHAENGHCLCFSDMPGGPRIAGECDLRYHRGSGHFADTAVISRLTLHSRANSNKASYRDWNFTRPGLVLEASDHEGEFRAAPTAPGIDYDTYRYPHLYQTQAEGERYAKLRLLRQLTYHTWLEAESDAARFLPGFTFMTHGHERDDVNAGWWVTAVTQAGEQPQVLEHEAPDRGMRYAATVEAIPEATRYVPATAHHKPRITDDQTAVVTGPAGEEIHPDQYGRVKVQFFWDREGRRDENSTCWVRVAQGWAGSEYGLVALPRVGHEVIVSFLEGDPDRPLITGRLYHAGHMPPYALPEHKTRTLFKTLSSPGGKGPRGFNEFRVEDKDGQEEIYVHAEKDVNIHVNNDWNEHILNGRHRTVDRDTYVETTGETHETLRQVRRTDLSGDDNLTVHADRHAKADGKWLVEAGSEIHLYAGDKAVFEAGTEATLKAGGSWVKLDPAGVFMSGPVINLGGGGSPGAGTPARPQLPVNALSPDAGQRVQAARIAMPPPSPRAIVCQCQVLSMSHDMELPIAEKFS